ncbi:MAG TPA: GNAT family N-acetyltransferase [Spirochaetia bacterium]|nr:GNAT family N-acetyltransferase [Spirochaetia bacterium]
MPGEFRLRELGPEDGPAIAALDGQSPDGGTVAFSTVYLQDPFAALSALHPGVTGVAAVSPDHPGIVGMGAMTMGHCLYEGDNRPYAYLFNISVNPELRRRGIASRIYSWLIGAAREKLGDDTIIVAGIQNGNDASIRAASVWSSDLVQRTRTVITRMRTSPPRPLAKMEVREAEEADWDEIAMSVNRFYGQYNLYPPQTGQSLRTLHGATTLGFPIRHYYVVIEAHGSIVAGLSMTDEGSIEPIRIQRMPLFMRLGNRLLNVLPANGTMRRLPVHGLWFAENRIDAATYLWDTVRYLWRDRAEAMTAFVDPRSPLAEAIPRSPFIPVSGGYVALAAPVRPSPKRFLYHHA